jgi:hypothetical protein
MQTIALIHFINGVQMNEAISQNNRGNIFSHNKITAFYFFIAIFLSVVITGLPLITIRFIGIDNSFAMMIGIEFSLAFFFYVHILRFLPECKFKLYREIKSLLVLFSLFLFILVIQALSYFSRTDIDRSAQAQLSAISILTLIFIVPFYEEIFYRGCLFGFLCSVYNKNIILPSIVTSLFFSLMHTQHYDIASQSFYFLISLIFISIRIKTKSLLYSTILHSVMNAFVVFLNTQDIFR